MRPPRGQILILARTPLTQESRSDPKLLAAVYGECEQHVARLARDERITGVHEHHAAHDDGAGPVERAAVAGDAVDRVVRLRRVYIPDDRASVDCIGAQMSIDPAGKDDARNRGDGRRLGGAAPWPAAATWVRSGPDDLTRRRVDREEATA